MNVLLIPSAVLISHDMRRKFGEIPTGLFPLGNVTMLARIYEKYKHDVDDMYVVVHKNKDMIKEYLRLKKIPIKVLELDRIKDLGYTITYGLKEIKKEYPNIQNIYINFADSIINDSLPVKENNVIYYDTDISDEKWTFFKLENNRITNILDKDEITDEIDFKDIYQCDFNKIFVGVFKLDNIDDFIECFYKGKASLRPTIDSFYRAIYFYTRKHPTTFIKANKWFDVGHCDNYIKAKTSVDARSFNTIRIDESRGILKKTSINKEKLINEIRWYLKMPGNLQYLLPRIYDYSLDFDVPYVSMEYYGYRTLHEVLLYGNISREKWKNIFTRLLFAIQDMEKYKMAENLPDLKKSLESMYIDKTLARLNKIKNQNNFRGFFYNPIKINNKIYKPLDEYIKVLPELIHKLLIDSFNENFNIIHGDLCFANILIEDVYSFIRLIDPRGKFGKYDIYGDSRYELAKLLHTLEGNYDFIIEDMFDIKVENNIIEYNPKKVNDEVIEEFYDVFGDKLKNINAIRLIEATLFLSMIPLHNDQLRRQYAMLSTGIILLDSVINQM